MATWKVVEGFRGTADMPDLCDFYPLPYDDELRAKDKADAKSAIDDWYKKASQEMSNFNWSKN